MLASTKELLLHAQKGKYAIGAFNIYNLEGLAAVIDAAEELNSPVMVQLHPVSLEWNHYRIIAACLSAAKESTVPVSIHLDHASNESNIVAALNKGVTSIMADGSDLLFEKNLAFTKSIVKIAGHYGAVVEGEFGKLAGEEDGLEVEDYEAKMTDPELVSEFVTETGVSSLAVCIGNVHGKYANEPDLDFSRLEAIRTKTDIPLVLHGASGIPEAMVKQAIATGVCKFNVNTEIRGAYISSIKEVLENSNNPDIVPIIRHAVKEMKKIVKQKITLFGSIGKF